MKLLQNNHSCPACGKPFPLNSRFCGGCGIPLNRFIDSGNVVADNKPQKRKKNRKIPYKLKHIAANYGRFLLLTCLILCLAPIFIFTQASSQLIGENSIKPVLWKDFRSHISRNCGITLAEVDRLWLSEFSNLPNNNTILTAENIHKFKKVLKTINIPLQKVFNWLPYSGYLLPINLKGFSNEPLHYFSDVSTDHAVYVLWKPLLTSKIPTSILQIEKKTLSANPYEQISLKDWDYAVYACLSLMNAEEIFSDLRKFNSFTSIYELILSDIKLIRQALNLSLKNSIIISQSATRLEAFALLSQILSEYLEKSKTNLSINSEKT